MIWRPLLFAILLATLPSGVAAREDSSLDLRTIPIGEWVTGADMAEIPWRINVGKPELRMDQRIEIAYSIRIGAKQLNRSGNTHELFFITRVGAESGEWLNEAAILHQRIEEELPGNATVEFNMKAFVQPGKYILLLVLYDRVSGLHNVARRRVTVSEIKNDPLPFLFRGVPLAEFPRVRSEYDGTVLMSTSRLSLPVATPRPVDIQLISTLNPPPQWVRRFRMVRIHNTITIGALAALSQMDVEKGSISIAGLDLTRQAVLFEQEDFQHLEWPALMEALEKAQSPEISAAALGDRKNNGAFFREYLAGRLEPVTPASDSPLRVVIVVTSPRLFESGSDLNPISLEGDCHCRVYHLRFRLSNNDVFDELEKFMRPLRPRTFNLMTPQDLRKAIAEMIKDIESL